MESSSVNSASITSPQLETLKTNTTNTSTNATVIDLFNTFLAPLNLAPPKSDSDYDESGSEETEEDRPSAVCLMETCDTNRRQTFLLFSSKTTPQLLDTNPADTQELPCVPFWRTLTSSPTRILFSIAVPSSDGWENEEAVHWFNGFAVDSDMFVQFPKTAGWGSKDLTTALLAVLEAGQDIIKAAMVWLIVRRDPDELENLVHALMYAGFEADEVPAGVCIDDDDYLAMSMKI